MIKMKENLWLPNNGCKAYPEGIIYIYTHTLYVYIASERAHTHTHILLDRETFLLYIYIYIRILKEYYTICEYYTKL